MRYLQVNQGRQVIKYSRWETAQFVVVQPPAIYLTVFHFKAVNSFLTDKKIDHREMHARVIY